jgi:RND family efflux transporter MFP subunit
VDARRRVRAEIVNVAPDVSGAIVELPVHDNQLVKKGDLIMQIDPSHYQIAVEQAQAAVAARRAELQMRRDDAARRADLDALVVSKENRENAAHSASSADAQYQQAIAALDAAKLNLERTRVIAPVDGYITNLQTFKGTMRWPARRSSRSSTATRSGCTATSRKPSCRA